MWPAAVELRDGVISGGEDQHGVARQIEAKCAGGGQVFGAIEAALLLLSVQKVVIPLGFVRVVAVGECGDCGHTFVGLPVDPVVLRAGHRSERPGFRDAGRGSRGRR